MSASLKKKINGKFVDIGDKKLFRGVWESDAVLARLNFEGNALPAGVTPSLAQSGQVLFPFVAPAGSPFTRSAFLRIDNAHTSHYAQMVLNLANYTNVSRVVFTVLSSPRTNHAYGENTVVRARVNGTDAWPQKAPSYVWNDYTVVAKQGDLVSFGAVGNYGAGTFLGRDEMGVYVHKIEIYGRAEPYMEGQFVTHDGKMWKSEIDNNTSTPGSDLTWVETLDLPEAAPVVAPTSGYHGDFQNGSNYVKNEMVSHDRYLWAALVDTAEAPVFDGAGPTLPVSDTTANGWAHNGVSSVAGDVVTLVDGPGASASVVSRGTYSDWPASTLKFEIVSSGAGDKIQVGILDAAQPVTSKSADGIDVAGFWGFELDLLNDQYTAIWNGVRSGSINANPEKVGSDNNTFTEVKVGFSPTGMIVIHRGLSLASFEGVMPTFQSYRYAIGASSDGVSGTFRVRGIPSSRVRSPDWRKMIELAE